MRDGLLSGICAFPTVDSGKKAERSLPPRRKGVVRKKAKRIAEDVLSGAGNEKWKDSSEVLDYLKQVTLPAIQGDRLADSTTRRYELAYRLLRGECSDEGCKHLKSLAGLKVREAVRPRTLTSCLEEIGRLHGAVNAEHAKTVAKKYLAAPLRVDEVIDHNPLNELDIDLSGAKKPKYSRGGRALTAEQYGAAIAYLLAADPEDVEKPKRGRWTREQRATERAGCIAIILAQATTGLRTSELCLRPVEDCSLDDSGTFIVELAPEVTKTRNGRPVPVLAPAVSERLAKRLDAGSPWLFPSPTNSAKVWDPRSRDRKLAVLYQELAKELDISMFEQSGGIHGELQEMRCSTTYCPRRRVPVCSVTLPRSIGTITRR